MYVARENMFKETLSKQSRKKWYGLDVMLRQVGKEAIWSLGVIDSRKRGSQSLRNEGLIWKGRPHVDFLNFHFTGK